VSGAARSTASGSTLPIPRGQLKSSARPVGATMGSPLVSVQMTVASAGAPRQDDEPHRGLPAELSAILRALGVLLFAGHRIARPERFENP
jgi:hypothetical protein